MRTIDTSCAVVRSTAPALDDILGHAFPILDHGFIRAVDYMGNDEAIIQMARVSYGDGTEVKRDGESLIRYLMRHTHSSPFEGCEIKFHLKLPIFVMRQLIRHRTANVNECSARYSILSNEFFVPEPERLGRQSTDNKQGTGEHDFTDMEREILDELITDTSQDAHQAYTTMLDLDLSRELARAVLPVNFYTECYWKIDLHNLFHFLRLRLDSHAQEEIRVYAAKMLEIVQTWVPMATDAFMDYHLDAVTFSAAEMEILKATLRGVDICCGDESGMTQREVSEFLDKMSHPK